MVLGTEWLGTFKGPNPGKKEEQERPTWFNCRDPLPACVSVPVTCSSLRAASSAAVGGRMSSGAAAAEMRAESLVAAARAMSPPWASSAISSVAGGGEASSSPSDVGAGEGGEQRGEGEWKEV